jgi:hypothetical protein
VKTIAEARVILVSQTACVTLGLVAEVLLTVSVSSNQKCMHKITGVGVLGLVTRLRVGVLRTLVLIELQKVFAQLLGNYLVMALAVW